MKTLFFLLIFTLVLPAFATEHDGPCADLAKQGALRTARSEFKTTPGDSTQVSAKLLGILGNKARYIVTLTDRNETWSADYNVVVQGKSPMCHLQFAKPSRTH